MRVSLIVGVLGLLVAIGARIYGNILGEMTIPGYVVMYAGLVGVLYWLYDNVEALILSFRTRGTRQSGMGVLIVLLGIGVFLAANYIAFKNPKRYDATDVGLFTLAPQTLKVAEALDQPVRVLAFYPETMEEKARFKTLIEGYQLHTDKLEVLWIDPDFEPAMAKQYAVRIPGTVVLEMGPQTEQLTNPSEEDLTNALIGLSRTEQKVIYILEGHRELSAEDVGDRGLGAAVTQLKKKGFGVEAHHLVSDGDLPESARFLVIPGPSLEPLEPEIALLKAFLARGGRVLLMVDPGAPRPWLDLAESYGFALPEAIVVDQVGQSMVGDATMPIVTAQGFHPLTEELEGGLIIFQYARPVLQGVTPEGVKITPLIATTPNAWGETNLDAFKIASSDLEEGEAPVALRFDPEADVEGPVGVMSLASWTVADDGVGIAPASAEGEDAEEGAPPKLEGMFAVVGDSNFAGDLLFEQGLNGDLFLGTVSTLAQEESLISIRPRAREATPFTPTESQGSFIAYTSLVILPGLPLLLAVAMYFRRRNL